MKVIFLTYVNRSGSTYLANILSSSTDVCVCQEGDKLVEIFLEDPGGEFTLTDNLREKLWKVFREDHKLKRWNIQTEVFSYLEKASIKLEAFYSILEYYRNSFKPEASHVLFKAERISALMEKIHSASSTDFNSALFLSLIRDPRAVFASQKTTKLPGSEDIMAGDPVVNAWKWKSNTYWALKAESGDLPQIIIKFESLIKAPDQTLQEISDFTSLDLSGCKPGKGDLAGRLSDEEKRIHQRVQEPPDLKRLNEWVNKLSIEEIYLIDQTGKSVMEKLGYSSNSKKLKFGLEVFRLNSILGIHLNRLYRKIKFRLIQ